MRYVSPFAVTCLFIEKRRKTPCFNYGDIAVKEAKEKVETVLRLRNVYATVEASKFDTEGLE